MNLALYVSLMMAFPATQPQRIATVDTRCVYMAMIFASEESKLSGRISASIARCVLLRPRTQLPDTGNIDHEPTECELKYRIVCTEERDRLQLLQNEVYNKALVRVKDAANVVAKRDGYSVVLFQRPEGVDIDLAKWGVPDRLLGVAIPEVAFADLQSTVDITRSVVDELKEQRTMR